MGALLNFLGGAAFRILWNDVSQYFTKRQDHKLELERMKVQGELDAAQHARNQEAIRTQAELGIKTINVQADADVSREEARGWADAVANLQKPTGIKWVDAWNASVRPAFASVSLFMWLAYEYQSSVGHSAWALTAFSLELLATIAGFYFASRELAKKR